MMPRTIALLTDFGNKDMYVGVMKAVMRQLNPDADFIDLTHAIAPQNVRQAALALLGAYRYFPPNTVFLVVVDPGVGSARRPIAVQTTDYVFVAPDNGVLSYALADVVQFQAVELRQTEFHLKPTSQTFHGRDIFAPIAAHLANGVALDRFGPSINDVTMLPAPQLAITPDLISGEVVNIDHFGNIVTSIGHLIWEDAHALLLQPRLLVAASRQLYADRLVVNMNGHEIRGVKQSYSDVGPHEVLALVGSNGLLELAVNQGSGAERLLAAIGDQVELRVI